ncbi:MAG: helix-turn-helix domain-containing protein [Rhodospirillaceae bacterium]
MTQPVQSFNRGLLILEYLNRHNGTNANTVARETGLTRGTTFRLLETLRQSKFVRRDSNSGQYWLERQVRALSDGYSDEQWIDEIARPKLQSVGETLVWPLTLSTPSGIYMLIRFNTDFESPLSQNRFLTGHRVPILDSASGLVFLSYCGDEQRQTLIEMAANAGQFKSNSLFANDKALKMRLDEVRTAGFAKRHETSRSVLSVPVFSSNRILACLAMRYFSSALTDKELQAKFLPALKEAAADIGKAFESAKIDSGI